jgi:hypothetical protein
MGRDEKHKVSFSNIVSRSCINLSARYIFVLLNVTLFLSSRFASNWEFIAIC